MLSLKKCLTFTQPEQYLHRQAGSLVSYEGASLFSEAAALLFPSPFVRAVTSHLSLCRPGTARRPTRVRVTQLRPARTPLQTSDNFAMLLATAGAKFPASGRLRSAPHHET